MKVQKRPEKPWNKSKNWGHEAPGKVGTALICHQLSIILNQPRYLRGDLEV